MCALMCRKVEHASAQTRVLDSEGHLEGRNGRAGEGACGSARRGPPMAFGRDGKGPDRMADRGALMAGERWTDDEIRYLRMNRSDGCELLAAALRRTPGAVRAKARALGIRGVGRWPEDGELCPVCGAHRVRPGSSAARRGMCPVCWEREKARAMEERAAFIAAHRRYNAVRQRAKYARDRS